MPLQETLDTYSHFITEADNLNLAYFPLVRYYPSQDGEYDGTYFLLRSNLDKIRQDKLSQCRIDFIRYMYLDKIRQDKLGTVS
jgi:hypothetical protein